MWLPLLWISLIATPQIDVNQLQVQYEQLRMSSKDENYLLNQAISLPKLSYWDSQRLEWRTPEGKIEQPPAAKVRILHLWAHWCGSCKEELPILKEMDLQIRQNHQGEVKFTYVALDISDSDAMKKFWAENAKNLPVGIIFGDHNDELARKLEGLLPLWPQKGNGDATARQRKLPLPVTLVLDDEGVVRQALVGSIASRRSELVNGVAQVYGLVRGHDAMRANAPAEPASKLGKKLAKGSNSERRQ